MSRPVRRRLAILVAALAAPPLACALELPVVAR